MRHSNIVAGGSGTEYLNVWEYVINFTWLAIRDWRIVNNLNHALIKNSNQAFQGCFDDEPLYEIEAVSMTTSFSLFALFASKLIFNCH